MLFSLLTVTQEGSLFMKIFILLRMKLLKIFKIVSSIRQSEHSLPCKEFFKLKDLISQFTQAKPISKDHVERVALLLAICARKPKVSGSSPAVIYVKR